MKNINNQTATKPIDEVREVQRLFRQIEAGVIEEEKRRRRLILAGISAITLLRQLDTKLNNETDQVWASQCRHAATALQNELDGEKH